MLVGRRWTATAFVTGGVALSFAWTAAPAGAATPGSPGEVHRKPLPLERLFDNRAVSDDASPGGADFDGAGNSLSAQDLRAAGWAPGRTLTIDSARLTWPRTADNPRADNVRADGQAVRLSGRGDALSFLVAGTGGEASGTGVVRYRDGSSSTYTLTAPDWRSGPTATRAVALPHVNSGAGQRVETARLYAVTVPVERGRDISSVVLPRDPGAADLHVFAASVRRAAEGWTGSWSASTSGYTAVGPWTDQTLRLVVHTSAGGPRARIRLANTFAEAPVRIGRASISLQAKGAAAEGGPVPLTFGGREGIEIAAGAQEFSDPVGFDVPADANLLVSIHLPDTVQAVPVHSQATQRSYLSPPGSGDHTADAGGEAYTGTLTTWPFLTGVDVGGGPGSVVTLGDSITDGTKSTTDANRRWPDVLARRLLGQSEVPAYGVLNQGISANRVVTDRYPGEGVSTDTGGVSALHRLERDVFAQTDVRTVVVFQGINDLRWGASAEQLTAGLRAIAQRAHERGLRVVVATIAPCEGESLCTADVDVRRTAVNAFIRGHGGDGADFDAVLDFDAVVRDPLRPQRILPAYDSGDHLHPGDAGLAAMADSIDLRRLTG
ncbi:SGNH/GDSL hydrolase family protein [Streptomyces sp. ME19-01-6]|uniref:SGNH/GDSL hydrolase family protein n=1 Tax=Streptomyces sp. ME19-01-6 TaxID=3028686 RepID=UPI0029A60CA7|nr:SGNH/GDSL hydrolase family protein [Streptomyces sp. ME19-01-6]MDX3228910.1 SGNH/GDSL hydrolase family protein [Streptomyces sp. ME19-01-6]